MSDIAACHLREDPVARAVKDMSAEEVTAWLVKYHGLKQESAETVISNLREQFIWHRLQGRLDQRSTAAVIAEVWELRQTVKNLKRSEKKEEQ